MSPRWNVSSGLLEGRITDSDGTTRAVYISQKAPGEPRRWWIDVILPNQRHHLGPFLSREHAVDTATQALDRLCAVAPMTPLFSDRQDG